jgi:carbon-monoxide dehydrogenase medium subunit
MSSSRHLTASFSYHRPKTLEDALQQLSFLDGVKVLAGGTDLLIQIKTGALQPRALVQTLDIDELNRYDYREGLVLGAAVQLYRLEEDNKLAQSYTALHEAVCGLGSVQIRNMATLGGNLCNASPSADTATPLLVFDAEVEIASLEEGEVIRRARLPLSRFFTGPGITVLNGRQLLTAVAMPQPPRHAGSAFLKVGRVKLDMAKISCSAYVERKNGTLETVRVAIGGAAPTPVRVKLVESALTGRSFSQEEVEQAARKAVKDISPISDVRSTEGYRRRVAPVLVRDTLLRAWERASGEV